MGRAPREGPGWTRAPAGSPPPGHPRRPPSSSHWRHSAGKGTGGSPGTTADALSAVRTPFGLDGFPGAQKLVRRGKGRRAQAAFRPRVLPGPSLAPSRPPTRSAADRRGSSAYTRPRASSLRQARGGGTGARRPGCSARSPTLHPALVVAVRADAETTARDAARDEAPGANFTGLLPGTLH